MKAYAPQANTAAFTNEGDNLHDYASAWRDRWNSVMELFMAGGNYALRAVPDLAEAMEEHRPFLQQTRAYPNKAFSLYDNAQNYARR